jgi:hypothetical protein
MPKRTWIVAIALLGVVVFSGCEALRNISLLPKFEQTEVSESAWGEMDGIYTTRFEYETPAGLEGNTVSLMFEDGLATSFEMEIETDNRVSVRYQESFITEMKQLVVGKNIEELSEIDIVAGATLTTEAFKNALSDLSV